MILHSLSVVITTHNRNNQLEDVLDALFKNDLSGIREVEVIVIDNGSSTPVRIFAPAVIDNRFSLRVVRQDNLGPAGGRNRGFLEASHDLVLFLDDDIIAFPDLLRRHIAAHTKFPRAVIVGQCPYVPVVPTTTALRYLESLQAEGFRAIGADAEIEYVPIKIVSSGNISIEKQSISRTYVYDTSLRIPVGEEYELSHFLLQHNTRLIFAREAKGWHLQPATLEACCNQNYKYGLGMAELAVKRPEVLILEQARVLIETNGPIAQSDSVKLILKKVIRVLISNRLTRRFLMRSAKVSELAIPSDWILFFVFRVIIGTYFFAGFRDGGRQFKKGNSISN